MIISAFL